MLAMARPFNLSEASTANHPQDGAEYGITDCGAGTPNSPRIWLGACVRTGLPSFLGLFPTSHTGYGNGFGSFKLGVNFLGSPCSPLQLSRR